MGVTEALAIAGMVLAASAVGYIAVAWVALTCRRCGRHYFAWGDYCRRCRRVLLARARRPFAEAYADAQAAHDSGACGGTGAGCRFQPEHER